MTINKEMLKIAGSVTLGIVFAIFVLGGLYFMAYSAIATKEYERGSMEMRELINAQFDQAIKAGQIIIPSQAKSSVENQTLNTK